MKAGFELRIYHSALLSMLIISTTVTQSRMRIYILSWLYLRLKHNEAPILELQWNKTKNYLNLHGFRTTLILRLRLLADTNYIAIHY